MGEGEAEVIQMKLGSDMSTYFFISLHLSWHENETD